MLVACLFINQRLRLKPCKSRGLSISLFCVLSLLKRHIFYWSGHIHLKQIVCLENIFKKMYFGVSFTSSYQHSKLSSIFGPSSLQFEHNRHIVNPAKP